MTRVLVLGASGMLGHTAYEVLAREFDTVAAVRALDPRVREMGVFRRDALLEGVDVTDERALARALDAAQPRWVLNAAGLVKQRREAANTRTAIQVNALFPHVLADLCEARGARMIHLSTDCVFSGNRGNYTEADVPDPVDLYGRSKLLGEVERDGVLTIRTSMIGRELVGRASLVEWFLSQSAGRVRGFTQAFFSGLTTLALSGEIARLIRSDSHCQGMYHLSADRISKFELLRLLGAAYAMDTLIEADDTFRCDRSLDSSRYRAETGFVPASWPDMVAAMAAE